MDDEEYLQQLVREYGSRRRQSNIRTIANAIYEFLATYHIDLNPVERERLSLYLVHYADSKKAARHIIPIHPSMRKIPDGVEKIAEIIEEVTDTISDDEFDNEEQVLDDELKKTLDEQPSFDYTNSIDIDTNRKKISKIKSFNKNNQEDET